MLLYSVSISWRRSSSVLGAICGADPPQYAPAGLRQLDDARQLLNGLNQIDSCFASPEQGKATRTHQWICPYDLRWVCLHLYRFTVCFRSIPGILLFRAAFKIFLETWPREIGLAQAVEPYWLKSFKVTNDLGVSSRHVKDPDFRKCRAHTLWESGPFKVILV